MELNKLVYLIPLIAVGYIMYANIAYPPIQENSTKPEFEGPIIELIDIGKQDTVGEARLLGPFERISDPLTNKNISYRIMKNDLVYFSSRINGEFKKAKVEIRFLSTIPEGDEIKVGMKNKQEWSYVWKTVYKPFYGSLEKFNLVGKNNDISIYSVKNTYSTLVSDFLNSPPEGSTIAASVPIEINTIPQVNYKISPTEARELRGDQIFYYYSIGKLGLTVKKQDLNWYNGSDAVEIKLFSAKNKLLKNITIPDDGNLEKNRIRGPIQSATLESDLDEGVYKVTLSGGGGDLLIRNIEIDSGNLVFENPFLAGILYTKATEYNLFTRVLKGERLGFKTYHTEGLQTVNITGGDTMKSLKITEVDRWHYIDLPPSDNLYRIEVPRGDVIINANSYFSFTRDSYFEPFSVKILPLQNSMEWFNNNKIDYIIVSNNQATRESDWTTASAEYNIPDAYIENGELNFVISATQIKEHNYSIPIDWIRISLEK